MKRARINFKEAAWLLALLMLLLFLWDTPPVYPLRILVVFFHELSHAIMTWLTGGEVVQLAITPAEGGFCVSSGGSRFLITSAGYLGSLLWGGALLLLSTRHGKLALVTATLGLLLFGASLLFVRPLAGFGFFFGLAVGLALIAAAWWLPAQANAAILKIVGLTSCCYALFDIKEDLFGIPNAPTDATLLAELTGIPALLWGLLWAAVAVPAALGFLWYAVRRNSG
ncbi:MAG: M50 family metallopeptidase [Candidatus Hydrogenedentes bacterium]|nr:M50 family metallopeptidase [Candidatus Hydrogenedentota bacterium]